MVVQYSSLALTVFDLLSRDLGGITGWGCRVSHGSVKKITCNVSSDLRGVAGDNCYRGVTSNRGL